MKNTNTKELTKKINAAESALIKAESTSKEKYVNLILTLASYTSEKNTIEEIRAGLSTFCKKESLLQKIDKAARSRYLTLAAAVILLTKQGAAESTLKAFLTNNNKDSILKAARADGLSYDMKKQAVKMVLPAPHKQAESGNTGKKIKAPAPVDSNQPNQDTQAPAPVYNVNKAIMQYLQAVENIPMHDLTDKNISAALTFCELITQQLKNVQQQRRAAAIKALTKKAA